MRCSGPNKQVIRRGNQARDRLDFPLSELPTFPHRHTPVGRVRCTVGGMQLRKEYPSEYGGGATPTLQIVYTYAAGRLGATATAGVQRHVHSSPECGQGTQRVPTIHFYAEATHDPLRRSNENILHYDCFSIDEAGWPC